MYSRKSHNMRKRIETYLPVEKLDILHRYADLRRLSLTNTIEQAIDLYLHEKIITKEVQ